MAFPISGKVSTTYQSVPVTARQRLLLGLLDALGGAIGNLDFQKVLSCIARNLALASPTTSCLTNVGHFPSHPTQTDAS